MTKREVAALICRVFSLWVVLQILPLLGPSMNMLMSAWAEGPGRFAYAQLGLPLYIVLAIGMAIILWGKAHWFAVRMTADFEAGRSTPSSSSSNIEEIQRVVFSGIGLLVLTGALPRGLKILLLALNALRFSGASAPLLFASLAPDTGGWLLEMVIGMWLLLDSRHVVRIVKRLQNLGSKKTARQSH